MDTWRSVQKTMCERTAVVDVGKTLKVCRHSVKQGYYERLTEKNKKMFPYVNNHILRDWSQMNPGDLSFITVCGMTVYVLGLMFKH